MKNQELLPCPFCGGEAEIKQIARNGLRIKCRSCVVGKTQKVIKHSLEWLREKMITDWNTRTPKSETK